MATIATATTTQFSTGRDISAVFTASVGGVPTTVTFSLITGVSIKQRVAQVSVSPLATEPLEAHIPRGWDISFQIARQDDSAMNFFSTQESGYWSGGTLFSATVMFYIVNPDGTTVTYLGDNVAAHLSDAGDWSATSDVKQTVTMFCSTLKLQS